MAAEIKRDTDDLARRPFTMARMSQWQVRALAVAAAVIVLALVVYTLI